MQICTEDLAELIYKILIDRFYYTLYSIWTFTGIYDFNCVYLTFRRIRISVYLPISIVYMLSVISPRGKLVYATTIRVCISDFRTNGRDAVISQVNHPVEIRQVLYYIIICYFFFSSLYQNPV